MTYNIRPNFIARPHNRFQPGFTLIEIMVVVAILALIAILTMPSIRAMQAGNAKAQAYNNINAALQLETVKAEVSFTRVTESEAEKLGLRGSPSVLVEGEDILPSSLSGFS